METPRQTVLRPSPSRTLPSSLAPHCNTCDPFSRAVQIGPFKPFAKLIGSLDGGQTPHTFFASSPLRSSRICGSRIRNSPHPSTSPTSAPSSILPIPPIPRPHDRPSFAMPSPPRTFLAISGIGLHDHIAHGYTQCFDPMLGAISHTACALCCALARAHASPIHRHAAPIPVRRPCRSRRLPSFLGPCLLSLFVGAWGAHLLVSSPLAPRSCASFTFFSPSLRLSLSGLSNSRVATLHNSWVMHWPSKPTIANNPSRPIRLPSSFRRKLGATSTQTAQQHRSGNGAEGKDVHSRRGEIQSVRRLSPPPPSPHPPPRAGRRPTPERACWEGRARQCWRSEGNSEPRLTQPSP
jgi:hypothetical protein